MMKFVILFVVLFSSLIVSINASVSDPSNYDTESYTVPTKCEDIFNTTSCSDCQKQIWDSWATTSTCPFYLHIIGNTIKEYVKAKPTDPYDLGPYNTAVKETCSAEFTCTFEEAETSLKAVEEKCHKELNTKVDWSANPATLDVTVASAYGTILFFYFGIPDHAAFCNTTSSSGELCGIDFIVPLVDWLKKEIPDGKFIISYDNKFVYKLDGSRIEIPRELIACGDCAEKMKKEYEGWPEQHPLPDYIVQNLFGSWEELGKFYTCSKTTYRNRMFKRNIVNLGFSNFAAASKLKFKF